MKGQIKENYKGPEPEGGRKGSSGFADALYIQTCFYCVCLKPHYTNRTLGPSRSVLSTQSGRRSSGSQPEVYDITHSPVLLSGNARD